MKRERKKETVRQKCLWLLFYWGCELEARLQWETEILWLSCKHAHPLERRGTCTQRLLRMLPVSLPPSCLPTLTCLSRFTRRLDFLTPIHVGSAALESDPRMTSSPSCCRCNSDKYERSSSSASLRKRSEEESVFLSHFRDSRRIPLSRRISLWVCECVHLSP